ncbi:MAG: hypothetical protein FJ254_06060 [Phycisphaerae bacterium]|nr:hypothetical protein [Phycisphaerae bacterium]
MLNLTLMAVMVPALVGIIVFLLPRAPWIAVGPNAQEQRRVVPGTAALSLGAAFALSVWLQEGTNAPWAQWHTVPFVIAVFSILTLVRGSHERPLDGLLGCISAPFMALLAAVMVFCMRFPAWTAGDRALAALAALPLAFILCPSIGSAPGTTATIGAVACGSMASLCMASGFAKLALALTAVAMVLIVMVVVCRWNRRITPGVGVATVVAALLVGSAAAGAAHDDNTFAAHWWWAVALSPVVPVITIPIVGRASSSPTAAVTKVVVVALVCAVALISAWGAKRASSEQVSSIPPCTDACFVRHCPHG